MAFELENIETGSLGLFFKRGALYRELLKFPELKEVFEYDWKDQYGLDRDTTSPTRYQPLNYSIGCYMEADTVADLMSKRSSLLTIISNPKGFLFRSETLNRTYRLYYQANPSMNNLTPLFQKGKVFIEFTLNLVNNFDETLQSVKLMNELGAYVLTELNEQIYVDILKREF